MNTRQVHFHSLLEVEYLITYNETSVSMHHSLLEMKAFTVWYIVYTSVWVLLISNVHRHLYNKQRGLFVILTPVGFINEAIQAQRYKSSVLITIPYYHYIFSCTFCAQSGAPV